ncbi:hypothetical protein GGI02_005516, partial [Coemansia sp. RSA 2322]
MAQFYISDCAAPAAVAAQPAQYYYYNPAVRHEQALDLSVKKLNDMRKVQRSTNRPPSLLKTVLVYNMFKAAANGAIADEYRQPEPVEQSMDVDMSGQLPSAGEDSGAAAEQSWFDRCIDGMLTEDPPEGMMESSFCLDDDDDEESADYAAYDVVGSSPAAAEAAADCGGGGRLLKRSTSIPSLCILGDAREPQPINDPRCLVAMIADTSTTPHASCTAADDWQ